MIAKFVEIKSCPGCGAEMRNGGFTVRACRCLNARTNIQFDIDAASYGSHRTPHLHVVCDRCAFEWLESVFNPEEFQRLL